MGERSSHNEHECVPGSVWVVHPLPPCGPLGSKSQKLTHGHSSQVYCVVCDVVCDTCPWCGGGMYVSMCVYGVYAYGCVRARVCV